MRRAFTLIELLIVVAIIAILAAIAVPNFLEAQTRAKVSRTAADQRSMATALEAYVVDWNAYPPCNSFAIAGNREPIVSEPGARYLESISTPVAYITNAFLEDPFSTDQRLSIADPSDLPPAAGDYFDMNREDGPQWRSFTWQSWDGAGRTIIGTGGFGDGPRPGRAWLLQGAGPDRTYINMGGILANFTGDDTQLITYDPTNGTVSFGSIYRVGGSPYGDPNPRTNDSPYGGGFLAGVARNQ